MLPQTADAPPKRQSAQVWLLVAIAVVVIGWALHVMTVVFVPIVCAIFTALLLAPLDRWVAERVPGKVTWLGHAAAMGLLLVILAIFFGSIWLAAGRIADQVPQDMANLGAILPPAGDPAAPSGAGGEPAESPSGADAAQEGGQAAAGSDGGQGGGGLLSRISDAFLQAGGALGTFATGLARSLLMSAGTTLAALTLIFFLTLVMLIEGPRWRDKIDAVLSDPAERSSFRTVGVIAAKLRRYLLARTIIGVATAVLYVAWLWIFGVELLIVWGLLAFLLNYIPNLGSLIAGILPVLYAFLTKDLGTALLVGAGILAIEQVMGNYVDPRVQGSQVAISPVVVLIALLVWGWIWGVAGAFLAVPMTIAIMVTFARFQVVRPFALLLSNETDVEGLKRTTGMA